MFHNRHRDGAGYFGAFPAYFSRITEFEAAEPVVGETKMDFDSDKVDDAVLTLLHLTRCDDKFGASAWRLGKGSSESQESGSGLSLYSDVSLMY